jgi:ethanolamine ammonia-lyase small subunit
VHDDRPPTTAPDRAPDPVTADPWTALRSLTAARVALGRAGSSVPTAAHLDFRLAHARARDAVHHALDAPAGAAAREPLHPGVIRAASAAADRREYLLRPDLGRRLDEASRARLAGGASVPNDAALVVADGLSAVAVERHAPPLLARLVAALVAEGWRVAPLVVVEQGRVAVGDEVGHALGAALVLVLIGERPGLSAPDSLGAYLTHVPRPGRVDAERNCVSNIRPAGLDYPAAAHVLLWLMREARHRRLTGVALKEAAPALPAARAQVEGGPR